MSRVEELPYVEFGKYDSKNVIFELLKNVKDLRYDVFVDANDSAVALDLVLKIRRALSQLQSYKQTIEHLLSGSKFRALSIEKRRIVAQHLAESYREIYEACEMLLSSAVEHVYECCLKYPWLRYLILTPIYTTPLALLPLIVDPPEACILGSISGPTNWAVGMLPITNKHENVRNKMHLTMLYIKHFYGKYVSIDKIRAILSKCYSREKVLQLLERIYAKKLQKYGKKGQAVRNTFREVVQIALTNSYLVLVYYYYNSGLYDKLRIFPKPPYEARQNPTTLTAYIDPIDMVDSNYVEIAKTLIRDIENITWKWYAETFLKTS